MKKLLVLVLLVVVGFLAYAVFWPSPFEPTTWQPPDATAAQPALDGNDKLAVAQRFGQGVGVGPEDVAVDARGRIYAGYEDGTIRRFAPDGSDPEVFATTNGRALGLAIAAGAPAATEKMASGAPASRKTGNAPDNAGHTGHAGAVPASGDDPKPSTPWRLIVADADKGLLSIDAQGHIKVLADSANGTDFGFTDDVDVADDGRIFFTDASSKYGKNAYRTDLLEHGGHGRLMVYDPSTQKATVLLTGLQFANGVAVGPNDRFVLVTETGSYRVRRYWLAGDKAGQDDVFIDNLAGFPDGISYNDDGTFWLALFAPRNPVLDFTADKPWLRRIVFHLPAAVQPQPKHVGHLVGLDTKGRVVADLQATGESAFAPVTSVQQASDTLYLGSLTEAAFARLPVPNARR